jgi:hypothetical protein
MRSLDETLFASATKEEKHRITLLLLQATEHFSATRPRPPEASLLFELYRDLALLRKSLKGYFFYLQQEPGVFVTCFTSSFSLFPSFIFSRYSFFSFARSVRKGMRKGMRRYGFLLAEFLSQGLRVLLKRAFYEQFSLHAIYSFNNFLNLFKVIPCCMQIDFKRNPLTYLSFCK